MKPIAEIQRIKQTRGRQNKRKGELLAAATACESWHRRLAKD